MLITKSIRCSANPYEFSMSEPLKGLVNNMIEQCIQNYEDALYYGDIRESSLIRIIIEHVETMLDEYCDDPDDYDDMMTAEEYRLYKKGKRKFLSTCKLYIKENLQYWLDQYGL